MCSGSMVVAILAMIPTLRTQVYVCYLQLNKFSNTQAHKSDIDVSSYSHRGVVYNTVVKFNKDGVHTQAAYVPGVSYGCDIKHTDICKQRGILYREIIVLFVFDRKVLIDASNLLLHLYFFIF